MWTKEDIKKWLKWAKKECGVSSSVSAASLPQSGKGTKLNWLLCYLVILINYFALFCPWEAIYYLFAYDKNHIFFVLPNSFLLNSTEQILFYKKTPIEY